MHSSLAADRGSQVTFNLLLFLTMIGLCRRGKKYRALHCWLCLSPGPQQSFLREKAAVSTTLTGKSSKFLCREIQWSVNSNTIKAPIPLSPNEPSPPGVYAAAWRLYGHGGLMGLKEVSGTGSASPSSSQCTRHPSRASE